ncbi:FAD-dependent oxidoreductase [Candidatus Pacearchaeota archaeon]|nr:FAD-dependent oxidoreductase [Candidatus Pacearchaeota archaeon]
MTEKYDLVIIGAGPAGLTAAIYAARYKLNAIVLGKLPGGLASEASEVWNYPGVPKVGGMELMMKMIKQVKELGIEIKNETVEDLACGFSVTTNKATYDAKKILIATGSTRNKLGLPREKELSGKGVSYCATCDSGFYKDKVAGVVGGGDAALMAADLLSRFATKVYIFYRKDKFFRGEPAWVEQVEKNKKIKSMFNTEVAELLGKEKLEGVKLKDGKEIKLDGLFIEVGSSPNIEIAGKLGIKMDGQYIATDKKQQTSILWAYAAGDITNNTFKQIVVACGEGATAVHSAYEAIQSEKSKVKK